MMKLFWSEFLAFDKSLVLDDETLLERILSLHHLRAYRRRSCAAAPGMGGDRAREIEYFVYVFREDRVDMLVLGEGKIP